MRAKQEDRARELFQHLHEPNETCLGLSKGPPQGNAIGDVDGEKLFQSIAQSRAIDTGVIEDLEDFRLFVEGIDKDKISDMTTNIIRRHLIEYTQNQCALWGISLQENTQTGFWWCPATRTWENAFAAMLVVEGKKILLTPKSVVSYCKRYAPRKYHGRFVLEFLQNEHIRMQSVFVRHRKNGVPYVTKKSLEERVAAFSKEFIAEFTATHPDVFAEFKDWVKETSIPISNQELDEDDPAVVATYLKRRLREIPSGRDAATTYHRMSVGILELLFYPDAISPQVEREIHEGRKRIDITFDNAAPSGFFELLHSVHELPSQYIFVECKNYSRDVENPEIDQLSGRFDVNTGKFGLLLCRHVDDMALLIRRCADTYHSGRGMMIPIVDEDLLAMLDRVIAGDIRPYEQLLSSRFRDIALR